MQRLFLACLIAVGLTGIARADTIRMAVTTSFENSGLADVLLPEIERDLGLTVQLLAVGTGQALTIGAAGDVDAVLVHARAAEEAFVAAGHGTHRREIMYNDFVLIGPLEDPAGIEACTGAADALGRIAESEAIFVSRGDDSGTHKMELSLWERASIAPETAMGRAYRSVGAGMGATLNIAVGLGGYVLSDRATWLSFAKQDGLAVLCEGDPLLLNQYALLPVSAERHPHVRADLVASLEDWLVGPRGKALIDGYRLSGEQLFVHNAVATP